MKKTIGGDRLGSGKRMKYDTKTFGRSTFNMDEVFRTTMSPGTLVPFLVMPTLPGDTLDLELDAFIHTLPTIGPLFGTYKLQLDVFQIPQRLYMKQLMINQLEIGRDISKVKIPQLQITSNTIKDSVNEPYSKTTPWGGKEIYNCQIEPSSILAYLGIAGLGELSVAGNLMTREFNALPYLMYCDIFKQYYANKMEDKAYMIHADFTKQDSLINKSWLVFNANAIEVGRNVETTNFYTLRTPISIDLRFENDEDFENFLEEEFVLRTNVTISGSPAYNYYKGSKDFIIQRNRSGLQIILTSRYIPYEGDGGGGVIPPRKFMIYSDISYDYVKPNLYQFDLKNIDEIKNQIMSHIDGVPFMVNEALDLPPYSKIFEGVLHSSGTIYEITALQCKQEGLFLKTYQSDIWNNWLNSEWITGENGVNAVTAIQVDDDGKFTLDEFNIKKKVYDMLNHIALSGGTYDDYQDVVWGVNRITQISSPVYEGGLSKEIVFQEVISNSATDVDGQQPLGTLAGRGTLGGKHKGGKLVIKTTEPSYVIGIVSITPRVDYGSGNAWHTNTKTMADWHNPYLDGIAFQDLITDKLAFWDTKVDDLSVPTFKSAGKQPSWIDYQTSYNKIYGNFRLENEQMFMVLFRRYEVRYSIADKFSIGDLTTYIDPTKYNHIFADTSPDAMNFWVQIGIQNTVRRIMSYNQIPNL